jgi:hypothetical protein
VDGQTVELVTGDVIITPQPKSGFAVRAEGEYVVALDTAITPELRREGLAREFVRRVQDLRKTAGFDISDRIATHYDASAELAAAVAEHAGYIQSETLTVKLAAGAGPEGAASAEDNFDGETLKVSLVKVEVKKEVGSRKKAVKAKPKAKVKAAKKKPAAKAKAKPKTKAKPAKKTVAKSKAKVKVKAKAKAKSKKK